MPRTPYDFSNEITFYLIKCNDLNITDIYAGSTFNFCERKAGHKHRSSIPNTTTKLYKTIQENGGWENWNMTVVDKKLVKDKFEATKIEQDIMDTYNCKLNSIRANSGVVFTTQQEYTHLYNELHKEERCDKSATFRKTHKELMYERSKLFRENNKEKIALKKHNDYLKQTEDQRIKRNEKARLSYHLKKII